jgi:hypothetical protein
VSRRAAGGRRPAGLRTGGDLRAGLVCLSALVVAGPLLGLVWAAVAPRLDVAAGIGGSETAFTAQADIDATFGFVCLGAGIIAGALARWRAPDGGWPVGVGLGGGGLAASLLAGWVGHLVRSPGVLHRLPPHTSGYIVGLVDLRVRSHGLYLVLPFVALLVLALSLWLPNGWAPAGRAEPAAEDRPAAPDEVFAAASAFRPATALPPAGPLPEAAPPGLPAGMSNGAPGAQPNGAHPPGSGPAGTAAPGSGAPASEDVERPA